MDILKCRNYSDSKPIIEKMAFSLHEILDVHESETLTAEVAHGPTTSVTLREEGTLGGQSKS